MWVYVASLNTHKEHLYWYNVPPYYTAVKELKSINLYYTVVKGLKKYHFVWSMFPTLFRTSTPRLWRQDSNMTSEMVPSFCKSSMSQKSEQWPFVIVLMVFLHFYCGRHDIAFLVDQWECFIYAENLLNEWQSAKKLQQARILFKRCKACVHLHCTWLRMSR